MSQWQYLDFVEPVRVIPRAGDWPTQVAPMLPEPYPRRNRTNEVVVCSSNTSPLEVPESQHTTWFQPMSEPVYFRKPPAEGWEVEVEEIPKSQHATWYQPLPEPVYLRKPPAEGWRTDVTEVPKSQHTTWFQPLAEPTYLRKPPAEGWRVGVEEVPRSQHVTWYVKMEEPQRAVRVVEGSVVFVRVAPATFSFLVGVDTDTPPKLTPRAAAMVTGGEAPAIPWQPPPSVSLWHPQLPDNSVLVRRPGSTTIVVTSAQFGPVSPTFITAADPENTWTVPPPNYTWTPPTYSATWTILPSDTIWLCRF